MTIRRSRRARLSGSEHVPTFGPFSKQDVARRQINSAINLLSCSKDYVSANTLAWASSDLLRGVAKPLDVLTFQEELEARIKPEFVNDWRRLLRAAYTFSKHADRDPDDLLEELHPEAVSYALFGSTLNYSRVFGSKTIQMFIYQNWIYARNPNFAADDFRPAANALAERFGKEVGGDFDQAVNLIDEIITSCLRNEDAVRNMLGDAWNKVIEPFSKL